MNKIENIDCLEYIKTLSDKSVDLVLTDPPYSIGFDGGKGWDSQWKTEKECVFFLTAAGVRWKLEGTLSVWCGWIVTGRIEVWWTSIGGKWSGDWT